MTVGTTFTLRAPGAEPSLTIANYGGPTHLIIDLNGYYTPQLAGFVGSDGTLTYSSRRIAAVSHPSTGNCDITFDRNVALQLPGHALRLQLGDRGRPGWHQSGAR